MKLILAAMDSPLADAWAAAFDAAADVTVHRGSILDVAAEALVSPANSFGFMDGGIDALYSDHFGWDLQLRLRRRILEEHWGELLVGQATSVETGNERHPILIAAPTMRVPMVLDRTTINPFLATRAAMRLALQAGLSAVAIPGMGTGVGRVAPELCARQMRAAWDEITTRPVSLPTSWAEASEEHQRLYTDRPVRLQ